MIKLLADINGEQVDLSSYISQSEWSGSLDEIARKLSFTVAYNTRDEGFINTVIPIGAYVYLYAKVDKTKSQEGLQNTNADNTKNSKSDSADNTADNTANETEYLEIFRGRVFYRERKTNEFTMSYVAYDDLVYLAKSKVTRKYKGVTANDCIEQVCNIFSLEKGEQVDMGSAVEFIADNMTCSEIIRKALEQVKAHTGSDYHIWSTGGKINVIKQGELIENYIATDKTDINYSAHSESIENMVNKVEIVNEEGTIVGSVDSGDINLYGLLIDTYKVDPKTDTQTAARALLKPMEIKSSIEAIGNIQCITGYGITIQEEQLKGLFLIVSDSHSINNYQHRMTLTLRYLGEVKASEGESVQ